MPPTKKTRLRDWLALLAAPVLLFTFLNEGGAGDSGDAGGEGNAGDGGGDDGGEGDAGDGDLGDAGKRALAAERAKARDAEKARKAAEAERDKTKKELDDLRKAGQSDQEKELEKVRKETDDAARADERSKSDLRIIRSEVKAAAGMKLADPNDAVLHLDLADFVVDDNGNVDEKKIATAIDDLLKEKPYLAAKAGKGAGSADGGSRGSSAAATKVTPGIGRLRNAYADSSKK